ncbi:DNA polymerase alpha catalytic subunit [Schistocerca cancellata]|uniref:DNA polymerase alpha catalytic subunit n=1 Tax=Schistocerca cancellata TaxID=274614 RepID=UPI002119080E|nr:DNA polymerase alpha catalytic subunit [Schistocerca cancellata]
MADTTPHRSRRQKADRNGRLAALEKLKQLKGSKNKYEVEDFENVYEEVDEKEYSKKVLERQVDDWIVDDDGSGYVEDGREIFDDDLDDESITSASRQKNSYSGKHVKKSNSKNDAKKNGDGSASIRNMLMNMPSRKRKREANVKLDDDDILGDIMQELHGNNSISKKQSLDTGLSPQSYLKSLAEAAPARCLKAPEEKQQSPVSHLKSFSEADSTRRLKCPEGKKQSPKKARVIIPATPPVHERTDRINPQLLEKMTDEEIDDFDDDTTIVDASQLESQQEQQMQSQIIEDFDSNDGFPDSSALAMIDDGDSHNIKENGTEKGFEDNITSNIAACEPKVPELPLEKPDPTDRNFRNKQFDNRDDNILAAWASMTDNIKQESEAAAVSISGSELPLVTNGSNKEVLRFFWLDAYEEPFKQPGVVYLFGKVFVQSAKTYVSCCVSVKNIERKIYLLPREERWDLEGNVSTGQEVKFPDVYEEFNKKIAEKNKILQFKCRKVERSYCFSEPGVPLVSEYLEVKYPAQYPPLPSDLKGETFSHVFGTRTSSLELLLLDRKIRGPCWLDIHEPQPVANPISWCKIEAVCSKMGHLEVSPVDLKPPPPLVILALNIRTVANVRTSQSEVVMVGCLVHNSFPLDRGAPQPPFQQHFCVVTRPSDGAFPMDVKQSLSRFRATRVEHVDSERALLCYLVAKVSKIDPDLIVGHDLHGFALELLVHRLQVHKVPHWSKLGRLRRANLLFIKGKQVGLERQVTSGRLICDVKLSAKELIRARSYDLGTLCKQVLNVDESKRWDLTANEVRSQYNSSESLVRLISLTMQDAAFILRLMCDLNVLPLALQITNIAGNVMSRTLLGGRSERNEFLLLHAFSEKDYIVPDKEYGRKKVAHEDFDGDNEEDGDGTIRKSRKKAQYAGGLVLEPKKGFYDKLVLLMDFNSLYPSIIQEYNICFTTVKHSNLSHEDMMADVPDSNQNAGILPTEIRKLVESRRAVKKLMKASDLSPDLKMQYNIRQMALKLTANSMYGCLGFSHSRFYARPIAALVTAKGREILINTKDLVEKMNYEVIYGDTDSLMINTKCLDYDEVFKIGSKIKQEINKLYKLIELDVDGVFKYLLLLKKKKYAAVTLTRLPNGELLEQQEHKGLDIVRRDWSQLSAAVGRNILDQILSDQSADERVEKIHTQLMKVRDHLHAGVVPVDLLAITKQLTKAVDEYADKKSLPHVQVAMRLNSQSGGKHVKAGDTVSYVICDDGSSLPASQRAYHVDELKENDKLKVDVNYYLSQQIHPVVSRLCDPVEGTDAARIAECLGLDPSNYKHIQRQETESNTHDDLGDQPILSDEERFKHCDRFRFTCMNEKCQQVIVMDGPYRKTEAGPILHLEKCPNPQCAVSPLSYLANIQNRLAVAIRHYIHLYYLNWLVCEDPACTNRTRRLPLWFGRGYPVCNLCGKGLMYREYTDSELYNQLSYFRHIFDLTKAPEHKPGAVRVQNDVDMAYVKLQKQLDLILSSSAYCSIDLHRLFADMGFGISETPGIQELPSSS